MILTTNKPYGEWGEIFKDHVIAAEAHTFNCKAIYGHKGGCAMMQYKKITTLYSRLSVADEDRDDGESNIYKIKRYF